LCLNMSEDLNQIYCKRSLDMNTSAGIRTIMITGDHKTTAFAIARELGIFREGDLIFTGTELDAMDNQGI